MATVKCTKCRSVLNLPDGNKEIICNFCGTVLSVPDEGNSPALTLESLQLEKHYEKLVQKARTYRDMKVLTETADEFYRLGTYKDSLQMAEYCLDRIAEEEQRQVEQAKIQEAEELRRKKEQKKYRIKMAIIYTIAAALLIAFIVIMSQVEIQTYFSGMGIGR